MPEIDWRSPETYERVKDAEITGFAWEWLRRSPNYELDWRAIAAKERMLPVSPEFRSKWGLCFRG